MVEADPKDAFRFSAMLFDGDGLLLVYPFSCKMTPTEGDRQQGYQLIDSVGLCQVRRLKAKSAAFEASELGFDLPAMGIGLHSGFGCFVGNQDEILSLW